MRSIFRRAAALPLPAALAAVLFVSCSAPSAQRVDAPPGVHPLAPLSADEISRTTAALRAAGLLGESVRVVVIETDEPPKARVAEQIRSGDVQRVARAVLYDWATGATTESRVDLANGQVVSTADVNVGDPPVRHVTLSRATEIAIADARVVEALERLGITDLERVTFLGGLRDGQPLEQRGGSRFVTVSPYAWDTSGELATVAGMYVRVDLTRGAVVGLQSARGPVVPASRPEPASTLRPLRVTQPEGPSFSLQGSRLEWDRWRIHFGVHPRRGLEVFDVSLRDGDEYRQVLYRGSLAELMTPYGDPSFGSWYPRDEGDYGITSYSAARAQAIVGADAPDNATFVPATLAGSTGQPVTLERAVAIYERNGGVLWRHAGEGRQARQLVLSAYSTLDNYDYLFHWIFNQDGSIDVQVQLTGVMNVRPPDGRRMPGGPDGTSRHFAHTVAPGIEAPNHQHFFSWRLDFDVDGARNRVIELDTRNTPSGPRDDSSEWFAMEERTLRTEREARRNIDFSAARRWVVTSSERRNALGQPTGFALLPGENAPPFQAPVSEPRRRAPFVNHHLWVTRYAPAQMYASGEWIGLAEAGGGVAAWTDDDEPIVDEDVVLWYTHSVLHLPRPEEWPIMAAHTAGFRLVPLGFFAGNPALQPRNR